MHNTDDDIKAMLDRMEVPEPSSDLEDRILAAAPPRARNRGVPEVSGSLGGWWASMFTRPGPMLALAASLAAVAVIMMNPAEQITEQYVEQQQQVAENRYTVDGIPLLMDVIEMEEEELAYFDDEDFESI